MNPNYGMPGNNFNQGGYLRGPSGTMMNPAQAPAAGPNYMGIAQMLSQYIQNAQAQQQQPMAPPPQIAQKPMQQFNMYPFGGRQHLLGLGGQ